MSDVLAIQNTRIEGSGMLGNLLKSDGFKIHSIHAKHENLPPSQQLSSYSMIIILGAPESANDNLPYLRREEDLIRHSISSGIPTLGICLGSQLMAKALGARVYKGNKTEIGFYDDVHPVNSDTIFRDFSDHFTVFHWHSDTFDLPQDAILLASSPDYKNQAFKIGSGVGIQFHLEVDKNMITLWLDNTQEKLEKMGVDVQKIRQDIPKKVTRISDNLSHLYKNFKSEFHL